MYAECKCLRCSAFHIVRNPPGPEHPMRTRYVITYVVNYVIHWRIQEGAGGAMAPLAAWASAQNALKVAIFRLKIGKIFWGGAMPPPQTPASFPLHSLNHNVVSNTLVLSPRAICIHTTASFPTSNGFWRLKRFKQSMEE